MEIQVKHSNDLRKAALLILEASRLGMEISGFGYIGVNNSNGNVYLLCEDYSFSLYIGLGSDDIHAQWSCPNCGEEFEMESKNSNYYKGIESYFRQKERNEGYYIECHEGEN